MKQTHGRRIIAKLKQRPHTYLEMMMLGISTCPWKRVRESLLPGEMIIPGTRYVNGDALRTWTVVEVLNA